MAKLPRLTDLTECPFCGYDEFYYHQTVKGKIYPRERFDGGVADNTQLYDGISYNTPQKTVYCGECQKKIAIDDRKK